MGARGFWSSLAAGFLVLLTACGGDATLGTEEGVGRPRDVSAAAAPDVGRPADVAMADRVSTPLPDLVAPDISAADALSEDTDTSPGCADDPARCDDGDPLTRDSCRPEAGGCVNEPLPLCSPPWLVDAAADACLSGADCHDGDPCTVDSCLTYHSPTVCICEPMPFCACDPGAPDGGATACDDGDPCTEDTCEAVVDPDAPHWGLCAHEFSLAACCRPCEEDGDCDDGSVHTSDHCDPTSGPLGCCRFDHWPPGECSSDAACGDGDRCTRDVCGADGACLPSVFDPALCPCRPETVALDCLDEGYTGDPCQRVSCVEGRCVLDWLTGPCDDGNACTVGERCVDGRCLGDRRDCDDGDPCSEDACAPDIGCVYHLDESNPDCR